MKGKGCDTVPRDNETWWTRAGRACKRGGVYLSQRHGWIFTSVKGHRVSREKDLTKCAGGCRMKALGEGQSMRGTGVVFRSLNAPFSTSCSSSDPLTPACQPKCHAPPQPLCRFPHPQAPGLLPLCPSITPPHSWPSQPSPPLPPLPIPPPALRSPSGHKPRCGAKSSIWPFPSLLSPLCPSVPTTQPFRPLPHPQAIFWVHAAWTVWLAFGTCTAWERPPARCCCCRA